MNSCFLNSGKFTSMDSMELEIEALDTFGDNMDTDLVLDEAKRKLEDNFVNLPGETTPAEPNTRGEILACFSAAFLNIQNGLILAYSATLIPDLCKPDSDIPVTKSDISWIASIVTLVAPLGGFGAGFYMESSGRIKSLRFSIIPYVLGWAIIARAQSVSEIVLGRSLGGIVQGIVHSSSYVYIAEVARPRLRGSLMSLNSFFASSGMLVSYVQGYLFKHWRYAAWLILAEGLLPFLPILIYCSPSPVWLVSKNRIEEARKSLNHLLRTDKDAEAFSNARLADIIADQQIQEKVNDSRSYLKKFMDTVREPQTYKPFWFLIVLYFLVQFTGVYITLVYAVTIFEDMGSKVDPYLSAIALGIVRVLMGVVTTYLLRSYGRRALCMTSGSIMTLTMSVSGYFVHKELHRDDTVLKWVPAVCMVVFVMAATPGIMTIPWIIGPELFPQETRAVIQGPVTAWVDFIMFASIKSYPSMGEFFGGVYRVHWFFAAMSLVCVGFVWLFLPETHNRKLIEIEYHFRHNTLALSKVNKVKIKQEEEWKGSMHWKKKSSVKNVKLEED